MAGNLSSGVRIVGCFMLVVLYTASAPANPVYFEPVLVDAPYTFNPSETSSENIGNIYLGDIDGDGIPDIAYRTHFFSVHGGNFDYINLYKSKPGYHYEVWKSWSFWQIPCFLIIGDWNRDGREDLF